MNITKRWTWLLSDPTCLQVKTKYYQQFALTVHWLWAPPTLSNSELNCSLASASWAPLKLASFELNWCGHWSGQCQLTSTETGQLSSTGTVQFWAQLWAGQCQLSSTGNWPVKSSTGTGHWPAHWRKWLASLKNQLVPGFSSDAISETAILTSVEQLTVQTLNFSELDAMWIQFQNGKWKQTEPGIKSGHLPGPAAYSQLI